MSHIWTSAWEPIREAGRRLYGAQEPRHVATVVTASLGGPDPLEGVDCYAATSFGVPHWHYFTYGFTELHAKESALPDVSGWGIELTMRVRRGSDQVPPMWPVGLLQNLARYTYATGRAFQPGSLFDANGPIAEGATTAITGLLFTDDPELPAIETTVNGSFRFVQVVGITQDELDAA